MTALEIGSICLKTTGREAGKRAVVIEKIDDNFVLIDGPQVRKRKCNITHLVPLDKKISVKKNSSKKELEEMMA